MKNIYFTVGPSQLYPTVKKHIKTALREDIPSIGHRGEQFKEIFKETTSALRALLNIPSSHHIFFTSCALEGMERTIENTVYKKSFHLINGSFSKKFYQTALDLKKEAGEITVPQGQGFNFAGLKIPKDSELIALTENETSTGVALPMEQIYRLKANYPQMLLAIDIVSSVPSVAIDYAKIDIAFFSVQKGFGLPAGLGVMIVHEKALEKALWIAKKGVSIGSYHNFSKLSAFADKYQTHETPNVSNIYLLGKVAQDMLAYGMDTIRDEIDTKADLLYRFFDEQTHYNAGVEEQFRSKTTLVIDVPKGSEAIIKKLAKSGFIISKGYGKRKGDQIRIANFPAHKIRDVKKLINYVKLP